MEGCLTWLGYCLVLDLRPAAPCDSMYAPPCIGGPTQTVLFQVLRGPPMMHLGHPHREYQFLLSFETQTMGLIKVSDKPTDWCCHLLSFQDSLPEVCDLPLPETSHPTCDWVCWEKKTVGSRFHGHGLQPRPPSSLQCTHPLSGHEHGIFNDVVNLAIVLHLPGGMSLQDLHVQTGAGVVVWHGQGNAGLLAAVGGGCGHCLLILTVPAAQGVRAKRVD